MFRSLSLCKRHHWASEHQPSGFATHSFVVFWFDPNPEQQKPRLFDLSFFTRPSQDYLPVWITKLEQSIWRMDFWAINRNYSTYYQLYEVTARQDVTPWASSRSFGVSKFCKTLPYIPQ
jgi:hypothetical protein